MCALETWIWRKIVHWKKLPWKTLHKFHLCIYINPKLEILTCFSDFACSSQRGTLKDTVEGSVEMTYPMRVKIPQDFCNELFLLLLL